MIRLANNNDKEALGKVYCLSWKTAYNGIIPNDYLDTLTIENSTPNNINPDNNIVVEDNGIVVGVTAFGDARDKSLINIGELRTIYVLSEYWNKGYGKELFLSAKEKLESLGYTKFYLWVLKDNQRARNFYEKMNMTLVGEEKTLTICGEEIIEVKYEYYF